MEIPVSATNNKNNESKNRILIKGDEVEVAPELIAKTSSATDSQHVLNGEDRTFINEYTRTLRTAISRHYYAISD